VKDRRACAILDESCLLVDRLRHVTTSSLVHAVSVLWREIACRFIDSVQGEQTAESEELLLDFQPPCE